jgi:hypothetical protein
MLRMASRVQVLGVQPVRFIANTHTLFDYKESGADIGKTEAMDNPTLKQTSRNALSSIMPGFDKVGPKSYNVSTSVKDFEVFITELNPVQIPKGCLFSVISCVDKWSDRTSLLNKEEIEAILNGQKIIENCHFDDFEERSYFKAHLMQGEGISEEQRNMTPTDKRFIIDLIGHRVLKDIYISAAELSDHFKETNQPIYSMLKWDEGGYQVHAVLAFGIDSKDNVVYWDVSDRLSTKSSRVRKMHIEEFNKRRNLPIEYSGLAGILSRSPIYYFDKEK